MRLADFVQSALMGALYPAAAYAPGGAGFVWCAVGSGLGGFAVASLLIDQPPRQRLLRLVVAVCMGFGLGPGLMEIFRIPESAGIALLIGTVLAVGGWGVAVMIQETLPAKAREWLTKVKT